MRTTDCCGSEVVGWNKTAELGVGGRVKRNTLRREKVKKAIERNRLMRQEGYHASSCIQHENGVKKVKE